MTPEQTPPVDPLWVTLLPSFGSALLFVAAMITLIVTIKSTNKRAKDDRDAAQERANDDREAAQQRANADRDAALERARDDRTAARQREFNNWRRDALLHAALDATTAAMDAHREYTGMPDRLRRRSSLRIGSASGADDPMIPINQAMRTIEASAYTIGLIAARNAASQCIQIREAIKDARIVALAHDIAKGGPNDAQERYNKLLDRITWYANQFGVAVDEELRSTAPDMAELPPLPNITQWEGHEGPPVG